jgi:ribosomal protein S18 acetylase RimI-like enzyme/glycosyltransferase involved in cell wall biosynthesis
VKQRLKQWWFRLLGKDPEAVIVCFRSGPKELADAMCEEIRRLEPDRRHFEVTLEDAGEVRNKFRRYRIGLAPVLFTSEPKYRPLRRAAVLLAPRKILAYNARLERHHLHLSCFIASWLFLRGVPLDRIFLRPRWLVPWRADKTLHPRGHRVIEGSAAGGRGLPLRREILEKDPRGRKTVAVLTPYFPYPLSHGGAVRIFYLLREMAREFDIVLYAFAEGEIGESDLKPVLDLATQVYLVPKPRYREPRWSTLAPPEACEYDSPEMRRLWKERRADVSQVEYTALARYGGDVLVEHDVTCDLYSQIWARKRTLSSWWDWRRWRWFELRAIPRFRQVVAMSDKDRKLLTAGHVRVIENGVDFERFQPQPETPGRRLFFIGSFRHFPNIAAFRFLADEILPLLDNVDLTVVAGPDPWTHWRNYTGTRHPPAHPRIRVLEFVADVRPLYAEANLVVVPMLESAGTNLKVLEALAMHRAVVSTTSGCAGLGLEHGSTAWIADSARGLADGIARLLDGSGLRHEIAQAAYDYARVRFDWRSIGSKQRDMLRELAAQRHRRPWPPRSEHRSLPRPSVVARVSEERRAAASSHESNWRPPSLCGRYLEAGEPLLVRSATAEDLDAIGRIQAASPEAAQWSLGAYLEFECTVAVLGQIVGFLVARQTASDEREILNLAVDPAYRRRGMARHLLEHQLIEHRLRQAKVSWFLEVRESNAPAIRLYESLGFLACGRREGYYSNPVEAGIVMRIHS